MREEEDPDRSRPKIVLHIRNAAQASKPPKKKAKKPSDIDVTCHFCKEAVTSIDIKAKNVLVRCADHKTHKYCQQDCIENH